MERQILVTELFVDDDPVWLEFLLFSIAVELYLDACHPL